MKHEQETREATRDKAILQFLDAVDKLPQGSKSVKPYIELYEQGYEAGHESWVAVGDRLPEENVEVEVTVQNEHDAYDPPTLDRWIERGMVFRGDHWMLIDDGHERQNVRYELDEIIAWREKSEPYMPILEYAPQDAEQEEK